MRVARRRPERFAFTQVNRRCHSDARDSPLYALTSGRPRPGLACARACSTRLDGGSNRTGPATSAPIERTSAPWQRSLQLAIRIRQPRKRRGGPWQQLESELIIQADQVAAISRDPEGKYHVHTTHGGASTGGGAVWGGFWGLLFGMLFFIPFAGWAMGAGLGALFGHMSQEGNRRGLPAAGARPPQAGHLGAVHGDRASHAGQGDRSARAVPRHRDQDVPVRRGHQEAPGGPAAAGGGVAGS